MTTFDQFGSAVFLAFASSCFLVLGPLANEYRKTKAPWIAGAIAFFVSMGAFGVILFGSIPPLATWQQDYNFKLAGRIVMMAASASLLVAWISYVTREAVIYWEGKSNVGHRG